MKQLIFPLVIVFVLCSCGPDKRLFSYFRDVSDSAQNLVIADTGFKALTIKADDLLQINVSSPNPEANAFFVTPGANINSMNNPAGSTPTPNTYLVDKEGGIDVPLIGRVLVEGKTTVEAKNLLVNKLTTYLKDPIVTVRLQNFKITVLGEVQKPANYIITNERVSVLDALGMAGDLTIFGKRENILLIREKEGKKVMSRLNLNNSAIFQSPNYYLQQNDIVYVEPNHAKIMNSDRTTLRNITIITSLISLITILLTRIIK